MSQDPTSRGAPTLSKQTTASEPAEDYIYSAKYHFHGGIHPEEHKSLSNKRSIHSIGYPPQVSIPLSQHAGNPAKPIVAVGEKVARGQMIATAYEGISASIHASISGTVVTIEERPVAHPSGMSDICIVIDNDALDTALTLPPITEPFECDRQVLIERCFQAGIVGLGGAAFPSHIKLASPVDTLIINAAECEPYITCDDRLIQEQATTLIESFKLAQYLLSAKRCVIAIEDNKPEAIAALRTHLTPQHGLEVCLLPTKYPSGGEKQLIELVTGIQVPAGALPLSLGITTHNVATCYALQRAVVNGEPLTERVVTLTGAACEQPRNYRIALGTPINWLIDQLATAELKSIVMGGPMMGFEIKNSQAAVVKSTNCLIFAANSELTSRDNPMPCIRCGQCADVCPASLLPQQLYWFARSSEFEKAEQYNLSDCIECGACAYVCPSDIPLVDYYRFAKAEVKHQQSEKQKADIARQRFEFRQERLVRDKEERALRHKKAAEQRQQAAQQTRETDEKKATIAAAVARAKARKKNKKTPQ